MSQAQLTPTQFAVGSLDLQQFIALKKEDIGTSIDEYFRRTNEAAGLSSEKKDEKPDDHEKRGITSTNSLVNRGKSTSGQMKTSSAGLRNEDHADSANEANMKG